MTIIKFMSKKTTTYFVDLGDLSIHLRHNYTVTRWLVRKKRVKISVFVGNKIIAERMTAFPCFGALACYVDDPAEILRLQTSIQRHRIAADLADAMQRRDPSALAQDALIPREIVRRMR